ncbi:alcohol dehydrogenase catalytic domain-containing protein [Rhodococcus wratislaviensis]|uniref:Putative zinc-containing alcohol dehydrogenase n=1 Tax=Rhodococcus wratislaviensis NBRC 100605 TaxID=1219028 RepID=X0QDT9_RHOWR|nr:Zn-dependent alcohol dehydrogenase [Rhodococcus wratislaviensis]GAF49041.1 putative zinc-containing alcohol dehydrogenase [Rhodococcus wratislaviensis NBRC 100605]
MRAAVLHRAGSPLVIEDVDLDTPKPGEVLVRIEAAGICHSDLHYMNGDLTAKLPAVLGHEGAGVVEAVGEGVARVQPGDTVITTWRPRCGNCEFCSSGRPALCELGRVHAATGGLLDGTSRLTLRGNRIHHLMGVSCFAERSVVPERSLIRIAPDVPPEIAAITGCAVITGVGAALNQMKEATGQAAVVIGAGGVGLSAIMGLNLIGANPIIAVDTVDARLDLARTVGATHVINPTRQDLQTEIVNISGRPAKWAIDAVGAAQTLTQAVEAVGTGGTVVAVGLGKVGATFAVPINPLVQQEKRIIGSLYGSSNTPVQIPQLLQLYTAGKLPLDRLVGRQHGLEEINDAYQDMRNGATGRAVIVPNDRSAHRLGSHPSLEDISLAPSSTSLT